MTDTTDTTWRELCPEGRTIFYEGDEPEKFVQEIVAEFGFDPSADDLWGIHDAGPGHGAFAFVSYGFHCPPQHLDAIYGSERWATGS